MCDSEVSAGPEQGVDLGDFAITERVFRTAVIVHVVGDIDMLTAPYLATTLAQISARILAPPLVILDLTDVGFMGSSGLPVLAGHLRDSAIPMRIVITSDIVLRILELTGFDSRLDIRKTLAHATADL